MATAFLLSFCILLLVALAVASPAVAVRKLAALVEQPPLALTYHKGQLLTGPISVHLIWYGKFTPAQRAVVADFVASLSPATGAGSAASPSVAGWWATVEKYHLEAKARMPVLTLSPQTLDESYSLGRRLGESQLAALAARGGARRAINVVLTSDDVAVDGFCVSRCGTHGSSPRSKKGRFAYIWVGNSASQCPGQCAWPFHQPIYGPQTPALVAPNGDVGVDGMVVNLASLLAGTVTNPFGNGYFQGEKGAGLEAASACTGVFGKGAYPGYPGEVIVDSATGGSYNTNGVNGRRYLLPALVDPATAACSTLV